MLDNPIERKGQNGNMIWEVNVDGSSIDKL